MSSGESVLLTGPAGSGKTYVLNEFIRRAKKSGKHVSVTATTGLAATHLGGSTIHSWSGMGIHDALPSNFFDHLSKARRETIEKTDVLIIDEISMMHDYRLDMLDEITRKVRGNLAAPFGGLQVILCGDFFQLPPVNRSDGREGGFVVNSAVWRDLDPTICYLSEQHRQDDEAFLEILNALRAGDVRRRHAESLLARVGSELPNNTAVTELYVTNMNVDTINASRLAGIEGEEHTYHMQTTGSQNYVETLKRSCLALEELTLKKGALVMCVRNSPDKKYVNGSLGVIVGFEPLLNYPIVQLRSGKEITIGLETWELRDGDKKRASITQIPLRLAWAITVHKSQGMTLDAARIDLRKAFVEGMGYVALSRVKRLDSLSLLGINNMALRVSRDALEIDELLRARAKADAEKFAHLAELAKKRKDEPEEEKKKPSDSSGWHEKIAKMRETHPNAFKPWAEDDDTKLKKMFDDGKSVEELVQAFGRHPGSIRARLKKHYGDEVEIKS
jgi:ATP-dependent exoDNAse (exonuclease V) alpha subunit